MGHETDRGVPISPMGLELDAAHEVTGTGTIFPDSGGEPVLHMHITCGRKGRTQTGYVRLSLRLTPAPFSEKIGQICGLPSRNVPTLAGACRIRANGTRPTAGERVPVIEPRCCRGCLEPGAPHGS